MANHKSALKRIRQNAKRRMRNKSVRSKLRTRTNNFEKALTSGDLTQATDALKVAESDLAKAASKGVIPRARAARKTGRLAKRLAAAQNQSVEA